MDRFLGTWNLVLLLTKRLEIKPREKGSGEGGFGEILKITSQPGSIISGRRNGSYLFIAWVNEKQKPVF